jgi:hypothetical protein
MGWLEDILLCVRRMERDISHWMPHVHFPLNISSGMLLDILVKTYLSPLTLQDSTAEGSNFREFEYIARNNTVYQNATCCCHEVIPCSSKSCPSVWIVARECHFLDYLASRKQKWPYTNRSTMLVTTWLDWRRPRKNSAKDSWLTSRHSNQVSAEQSFRALRLN